MTASFAACRSRVALVTGGTGGLGDAVCRALADRGWIVVVHGRNADRVSTSVARLGPGARGVVADLADLDQVAALAAEVEATAPPDLLVNNAAAAQIGSAPMRTRQGHPRLFQVNYLAPALLTRLLLPGLTRRAGRVLTVVAASQQALDFTEAHRVLPDRDAYTRAKLALVMDTRTLAHRVAGSVGFVAVHPGSLLDTPMVRRVGRVPRTPVADGCAAVLAQVEREWSDMVGDYVEVDRVARPHEQAEDLDARRRMEWLTEQALTPWLAPARRAVRSAGVAP